MRQAGIKNSGVETYSKAALRGLRLAAIVLGVGLVMSSHSVRAEDDEEGAEPSLMDNLMSGIGARPAGDTGIKYRERSPLVVPSKIALPPPASKKNDVPNWPKDPDEIARKEALEASKKVVSPTEEINQISRSLLPSELAVPKSYRKRATNSDDTTPGYQGARPLSPSELGYKGGLFSGIFRGNTEEATPFKGEPPRESLSQPPVGYQTPSPKYKYGTGPQDAIDTTYDPVAGKYGGR